MGFAAEDWSELTGRLTSLTLNGKIDWSVPDAEMLPFLARPHMTTPEFTANVGTNHFALGSRDNDGRPPFYLEVTRRRDTFVIKDTIRSDSFMDDPYLSEPSRRLDELWASVRSFMGDKDRAARDIIADLDQL